MDERERVDRNMRMAECFFDAGNADYAIGCLIEVLEVVTFWHDPEVIDFVLGCMAECSDMMREAEWDVW